MRTLTRNKQAVYYALYEGKNAITDEDGNLTGDYDITYSDVNLLMANVSPAKGASELSQFGITEDYTRTIVTGEKLPITETSVLWVGFGKLASFDAEQTYSEGDVVIKDGKIMKYTNGGFANLPHNYVIVRVADSINSTTYAVKEVEVT